ncbi:MAG TPA: diaminopimelate epimerase [Gammaproteobacteria bacterium]|nr:diaminopimelate epimerase [Gammaproteobacteria bacterium]
MHAIHYAKYTSNGNNFVILDEIEQECVPESKKSHFSKMICHESTGIGCDTLLIVQRYSSDMLNHIYGNNHYEMTTERGGERFIMRVFERDGSESYNCGNGLVCLGHYLHHTYQLENAFIATEIPSRKPFFRKIKSFDGTLTQATIGEPKFPDENFVTPAAIKAILPDKTSYLLKETSMMIKHEQENKKINLNHCYITFTGEPHIVIFEPGLYESITKVNFFDSSDSATVRQNNEKLIEQIGLHFNALKDFFPQGVNINFARVMDNGKIAYRCFERGVNSETYACGTGAVAVASIARNLGLVESDEITLLPWRARYEVPYKNAEIMIKIENQQYNMLSQSVLLTEGTYYISQQ